MYSESVEMKRVMKERDYDRESCQKVMKERDYARKSCQKAMTARDFDRERLLQERGPGR